MTLDERLQKRLQAWRKLAQAYRTAQLDCEPSEEEWTLNQENADMIERLAGELATDLAATTMPSTLTISPTGTSGMGRS